MPKKSEGRAPRLPRLVLTCEHAGREVPRELLGFFGGAERVLASHQGWDLGALSAAEVFGERFGVPVLAATVSRLVVDANRSRHHPKVTSSYLGSLGAREREGVLQAYWEPHRARVRAAVAEAVSAGFRVIHIAVHSFTPELDGVVRETDVGLLYDPARTGERDFCTAWKERLEGLMPGLRVRRNHPYRGVDDGFPTSLRRDYGEDEYAGIELELNQGLLLSEEGSALVSAVVEAVAPLLGVPEAHKVAAIEQGPMDPAPVDPPPVAPRGSRPRGRGRSSPAL